MSMEEIKDNIDKLDEKNKYDLIRYIHELLIINKRAESKTLKLKTEIKFINRHLTKIRDLITKTLNTNMPEEEWKKKE